MKGGPGAREDRGSFLRLDLDENTVGCSPRVRRALAGLTAVDAATDPDQHRAIARRQRIARGDVVLTAGTDGGLRLVVDAFADPRDTILALEPSFVQGALERMGIPFRPSAGNFVMADLGRRVRPAPVRLSRRGILLGDRTGDPGRKGWVRITAGTRPQMRRLIRELREIWK